MYHVFLFISVSLMRRISISKAIEMYLHKENEGSKSVLSIPYPIFLCKCTNLGLMEIFFWSVQIECSIFISFLWLSELHVVICVCVYVCKILYISVPVYCTSVKKQEVICFCINCITYSSCIMCRNQLGYRHFKNTSIEGNTVEPWFRIYLGEQAFYTLNQ